MKLTLLLLTAPLALAFAPLPARHTRSVALSAVDRDSVASSVICAICSLGLTAQIAVAAPTTVDQFTLPSYDAAKGVAVIDLKDEVQDVNKKTMANAKARREFQDNSVEKTEMDKLRAIEAEEAKLFESMTKQSEEAKKARVKAEIEESRANRWKTF
eukprot:scaffold23746_cov74-Cyclotella_meneghiniana.AAC.2